MKKKDLSWQSLRQKDINKLLIPQKKIKTIKGNTAINVSFSESAVAAHPFIIPDIAQMTKDISAILQMADITAEVMAPLVVDMPNYSSDYILVFEN